VRGQLTAAFVAYKRISPSDVAGTFPRSVYYAYDPATGTYWALAQFRGSGTESFNVQVSFQDGGNYGMFRKTAAGTWQAQDPGFPPVCGEVKFFPHRVLKAWSLPTRPPVQVTGQSIC
jgi:hypothetical protein